MRTFHTHIRLLIAAFLLCTLLVPTKARADEPPDGFSLRLGTDLRMMHYQDKPFWSGTIPALDVGIPIAKRYIQFELGWGLQWGFSKFYVDHFPDILPSLGLRIYPFGKYVSFYGKGGWGTFIFNNSTLIAETGGDIDIPLSSSNEYSVPYLTLGAGYFYRRVGGLGDFVERSNHPWWYMTGPGVAFRVGLLIRAFD